MTSEPPDKTEESDYLDAARSGFDPLLFAPPKLDLRFTTLFAATVNVDETIYTFSPKILDRAHIPLKSKPLSV